MEIINWTDYFIEVAKTASLRSNCLRAQVGAVIVANDKTVKATGYNGTPSKVVSCAERNFCYRMVNNIPSGTRYETCRSIHAEQNAIIQAGKERCEGATMYIYGHDFICILCKRFIVQSGIKEVFLRKSMSSPILKVTVDELRQQLDEMDYEPIAAAKKDCDCE
ncbi:MAG: dCMP deaminase family protein [Candidatus Gastranaerophilales bacterium]|nr:dCMP deaminase family protein [Candidatus Gastranaerophilales bacterium]